MWTDAIDSRNFYASDLGKVAQRFIQRRIRAIWQDVNGMEVLGLGFATPYLGAFHNEASHILAAMPAAQGVMHWPSDGDGLATLVDEVDLPFADLSINRVLLVHALESTDNVRPMLREIWRVLASGGRMIIVVPNRQGLWARFDTTPFGHGLPYSSKQLATVLCENLFTPHQSEKALFIPPTSSRVMLSSASAIEEIGYRWFPAFAGVTIVEATKQIYARHTQAKHKSSIIHLPQRSTRAPTREIL